MTFSRSLLIASILFSFAARTAGAAPDPRVEAAVSDLVARMTLEEKVGQMCQYVGIEHLKEAAKRKGKVASNNDAIGMYPQMTFAQLEEKVRRGEVGSFLHVVTAAEANRLQELARESRLQIPLIIGIDAIHGNALVRGATVYPAPIGLAATFDDALVERLSRETARETRAHGAQWAFSPNLDVARDARWGRVGETFGEDPLLVGRLGVAMVRGLQAPTAAPEDRVLACIKHALAGSQPVNGLNGAPTDLSERTLRSVFLPPYFAAIRAGAGSLMTAHNELNGVPCHANPWLIEEVLRGEGGFAGFVVSDWMDVQRLATVHFVAADLKETAYQTLLGGMDMNMHGPGFFQRVVELVREGRVPEARIDQSVRRILRAKFELGLFDRPLVDEAHAEQVTFSPAHQATALEAARKSIVLLKNDAGTLPLDPVRSRRILVTGPLADTHAILGDWVLPQPEDQVTTPLEGIRQAAPAGVEVSFFDCGRSAQRVEPSAITAAAAAAATADLTVVVVGDNELRYEENDKTGGENVDRSDIELPGNQLALVQALVAAGKPVVVVLVNGRPLGSEWTVERCAALIEAFQPGSLGGQALGEILFGVVNPSGRLPITIPRHAGQIQVHYNHMPSQYFHKYVLTSSDPLFWFGHGLSYTSFRYSNLRLPARIGPGESVPVTVDITNTGPRAGEELVLMYVRDLVSSATTPVKALKDYQRVALASGERKTVELRIAHDQLALIGANLKPVIEPGMFQVFVGDQTEKFELVAP
ncbi:MAG: beta-glucosidase [Verrucomicrobiota bacterium]|nr:beta-glucosidase [Verrucomicrobiota bacterium]